MAQIKVSRESLEFETFPPGDYVVQLHGFRPKKSKDKNSTNLQPQLKIVGHPTLAGKHVFFNLNDGAGFIIRDFVHCMGLFMDNEVPGQEVGDRGLELPGEFVNWDDADPSKAQYAGPLLGRTGRIELAETQARDKSGNAVPNKTRNEVKRFYCAAPGCTVQHKESLIR